jgi:hypothetical protein
VLGAEKEKKEPDGLFWAHAVDGRQRTLEDGNWWLTSTAHEDDLIGSLFRNFGGFCAQPVPAPPCLDVQAVKEGMVYTPGLNLLVHHRCF